jgi:hypothetical protein
MIVLYCYVCTLLLCDFTQLLHDWTLLIVCTRLLCDFTVLVHDCILLIRVYSIVVWFYCIIVWLYCIFTFVLYCVILLYCCMSVLYCSLSVLNVVWVYSILTGFTFVVDHCPANLLNVSALRVLCGPAPLLPVPVPRTDFAFAHFCCSALATWPHHFHLRLWCNTIITGLWWNYL